MDVSKIQYEPWKVVRLIGQGSFGSVYEIERDEFGEKYKAALKVISIPQTESEIVANRADGMDDMSMTTYYNSVVQELTHEFALLSKLKGHTNIVGYEDHKVVPHENGIGWDIYIRMEMLTSLTTVSSNYHFSRDEVIKVGIDICNALILCENKGIIHRDIKPDNIFISETGDFELGDFGIARTASRTGTMYNMSKKGTPNYMAPEVYKNEPYNGSVDIYSLGIVLYQLMNNKRLPFIPKQMTMTDRETALGRRMSGETFPMPENADAAFSKVILKACAYKPQDRYQNAQEMKEDLLKLVNGKEPVHMTFDSTVVTGANESYFHADTNKDVSNPEDVNSVKEQEEQVKNMEVRKEEREKPVSSGVNNIAKSPKSNNKLIIGAGAGIIAVLLMIIIGMAFGNKKDNDNNTDKAVEEVTTEVTTAASVETTETTTAAAQPAPSLDNASLNDFMFTLEGTTYKLPVSYADFKNSGWKLTGYSEEEDTAGGNSGGYVRVTNGKRKVSVYLFNGSGNTKKLSECNVCGIKVEKQDKVDFKIAKNISLENSSDEVKTALGTPSYTNKGDNYVSFRYDNKENDDYYQYTQFYFYNSGDMEEYSSIEIYYPASTSDDITEVSTEAPAYLSTYQEPTELGNEITSMNFEVGGDVYRLPCPLSEFIKNGWEITEKSVDTIASQDGESGAVTLSKGDDILRPILYNFDNVANITENCAVSTISVGRYYTLDGTIDDVFSSGCNSLKLPGNITLDSSFEDYENLGDEFERDTYDDSDYKSYDYTFHIDNKYIGIMFMDYSDSESWKTKKTIYLTNENWDYE